MDVRRAVLAAMIAYEPFPLGHRALGRVHATKANPAFRLPCGPHDRTGSRRRYVGTAAGPALSDRGVTGSVHLDSDRPWRSALATSCIAEQSEHVDRGPRQAICGVCLVGLVDAPRVSCTPPAFLAAGPTLVRRKSESHGIRSLVSRRGRPLVPPASGRPFLGQLLSISSPRIRDLSSQPPVETSWSFLRDWRPMREATSSSDHTGSFGSARRRREC